jgi:hypothetical protein
MMTAPSKEDLQNLSVWAIENRPMMPPPVNQTLTQVLESYSEFGKSAKKAQETLKRLREAMGILPKSERGKTDRAVSKPEDNVQLESLTPDERAQYESIRKKRDRAKKEAAQYGQKLRQLLPPPKSPEQMEFHLADAFEMVFSSPTGDREGTANKQKVERMYEFGKEQGLHSKFDTTKRVDLRILVNDITYEVETVTDPKTGKSVRASMDDVGPAGSQLTWRAIAVLIKIVIGFAIPINRAALMIGQPEFTSGKICRTLRWAATLFLPIYLYLAEALADAWILSGDDTKTKIIDVREAGEDTLARRIDDQLGWTWPKADGTGDKQGLNVSLLMGRSEKLDPTSTIRFFRTHQGSVGNLLTRLLEWRSPKAGPLIFQGDLSTTNLPGEALREKFKLKVAGCGSHARRPFWRYREDDELLCYFMLRGFLALSRVEALIDAKGRTEANVLKLRDRYSRKLWQALRNRCIAAVTGKSPGRFTFKSDDDFAPDVWPPGTELNRAAQYVINHFTELTFYLDNPFLKFTNNGSERALRIEKCFLSSSKFTKTRLGRAVVDVLRTINATCTAARIDLADYLRYVYKHRDQLQEYPERFTPYAVAKHLENLKKSAEQNT